MNRYRSLIPVLLLFFFITPMRPALAQDKMQAIETAMAGLGLSASQATALEKKLVADPTDLKARTELLSYSNSGQYSHPDLRTLHQEMVFWIIQNRPESGVAGIPEMFLMPEEDGASYDKAKSLWLDAVQQHQQSTAVLSNAANFFTLNDRAIAVQLLKTAESQAPSIPAWPAQLAQVYALESGNGQQADRQEAAGKSLAEFERAGKVSSASGESDVPRAQDLAYATKMAYRAGDYDKAERYATMLLQNANDSSDMDSPGDAYTGNMILGELAVRSGNLSEAERRLLLCGDSKGSPGMDSFGPNMSLAQDLLQTGQKEVVLQFLDKCASFWPSGLIQKWKAQIKQGKMPDFGANLDY